MNERSRARLPGFICAAMLLASIGPAHSARETARPAPAPNLSGLHDFDFLVGQWQVHHRRLKERLAGSHEWEAFDGTLTMRQLMGGWANVGDNLFKTPSGDVRGVGLRSYDSKTGKWSVWWLDGRNPFGNLEPPIAGSFAGGVGSFYSDETFRGKPVRTRVTWSRVTPVSARWEQAYSPDAGKTWETNWISEFARVAPSLAVDEDPKAASTANSTGPHDFDFLIGDWQVHHHVLRAATGQWVDFDGTSSTRKLMAGAGNVEDNALNSPNGSYRAVGLRACDAKTGEWAIWWLDGRYPTGPLDPPVKGRFEHGVGNFYSDDVVDGRPIRTRYTWSKITATSARWEQATSTDAGKSWAANWTMEFRRLK